MLSGGFDSKPPILRDAHYSLSHFGPSYEDLSEPSLRFACDTFMRGDMTKGVPCNKWHIYNFDGQSPVSFSRIFKEVPSNIACDPNKYMKMGPYCLTDLVTTQSTDEVVKAREGMRAQKDYFGNGLLTAAYGYFEHTARLMNDQKQLVDAFVGDLKRLVSRSYKSKEDAGNNLFDSMRKLNIDKQNFTTPWEELAKKSTEDDCTTPLLYAGALLFMVKNYRRAMVRKGKKIDDYLAKAEEAFEVSTKRCYANSSDTGLINRLQKKLRKELGKPKKRKPPSPPPLPPRLDTVPNPFRPK